MKDTFKFYISIILVIGTLSFLHNKKLRDQLRIEKENSAALYEGVQSYKSKDSLNVVSVARLTLTRNQLKEREKELVSQVEGLNIKIKRLNSVIETRTEVKTIFTTLVRDSIKKDTLIMRCFKFDNNYFKIDACMINDTIEGQMSYCDTLNQIFHRVPRKFLFIKYGTKAVRQEALFRNKDAKITYMKYIELN